MQIKSKFCISIEIIAYFEMDGYYLSDAVVFQILRLELILLNPNLYFDRNNCLL